jgi:uncharacterized cupin superfamily protein
VIAHWDEVDRERYEWEPDTSAWWTNLGGAAGTVHVGVKRMQIDPGRLSVPVHGHTKEEETVFVRGGSGFSWQGDSKYAVRANDFIVYLADREPHSLIAGDDGLDVLVFGTRDRADISYLPRTGQGHVGKVWFDVAWGERPPEQAGEPPGLSSERPPNIVNLDDVEPDYDGEAGRWVRVAREAGAVRAGLNWGHLEPGRAGASPHCHSADEELFVILEGGGTLELWPSPVRSAEGEEREDHPIRAGHVISRPPSTGMAHHLRAGDQGMTFLVYGTREPNDVCYYPRSNKIYWRGVGLIARLEPLGYDDGEPED